MDAIYQDFERSGDAVWDDLAGPDPDDAAIARPDVGRVLRNLERAGIGLFECNLKTEALSWTRGVYSIFGLSAQDLVHRAEVIELYDEESRDALERLRSGAILRAGSFTLDARITRPDGAERWMRIVAGVECENGRPVRLSGTKHDITAERLAAERLRKSAETDGLTGLANRAAFQAGFLDRSHQRQCQQPLGALVLFDIDGFKAINDRHGHLAGDACLLQFGNRLHQAFPDAQMVARIGGDEFAVLLPSNRHLPRIGNRIREAAKLLGTPVYWNGKLLEIGASHGIAVAENALTYDAEALFERADQALYIAKRTRKPRALLPTG